MTVRRRLIIGILLVVVLITAWAIYYKYSIDTEKEECSEGDARIICSGDQYEGEDYE